MTQNKNRGVSFLGLLTLLFIGLKLSDHIDWSWWWVLSPLYIPISVSLFLLGLGIASMFIIKPKEIPKSEIKKSPFRMRLQDAIDKLEKEKNGR